MAVMKLCTKFIRIICQSDGQEKKKALLDLAENKNDGPSHVALCYLGFLKSSYIRLAVALSA